MALTKITKADLDAAIKKLTTSDATVWWKVLATTDEGTDLCFVVGWEYYDDKDDRFYQDKGYTICAKIGYKPHNLMVMDYDDIYMPFDKRTGDVWDTDSAVDKDNSRWDMLVRSYNSSASAIWRKYGMPNRDGMTALDLMESKNKESLADNVNLDFKVGDFKGTRKSVISKMKKALDNKGIANEVVADGRCLEVTLDNANVVIETIAAGGYGSNKSASYVVLGKDSDNYRNHTYAYSIKDVMDYIQDAQGGKSESKKHTCSMQKKKESLAKKCEEYIPNVRERLWSFIDAGFITTEEIGDYLLRALSVDTLENVYEWLVQDEMIPSEETLADEYQLKFGDDGELVSTETDDSTESKKS